jgi:hypothetical protein
MSDPDALRQAAILAHSHGYPEVAAVVFLKILELFPDSTEAAEARYYLSHGRQLPPPADEPAPQA